MVFKKRNESGVAFALTVLLFYVAWIVAIVWGYILNFEALIHTATSVTGLVVARVVGLVVFPLGALLGFFA